MTPAEAREGILRFVREQRPPLLVTSDDALAGTLLEPSSGKSLRLVWEEVRELVEERSALRPMPYLRVVLADGRRLALADVGFAFAPAFHNSGPLPELPGTLCFRDLEVLAGGADALALEGRAAEATAGVLACIALLDGARAVGFDVGREEQRLERLLTRLERG